MRSVAPCGRLDHKKRVKSSADVAPSRQFVARIARSTQGMDTLTRYDDVNVEHDAFAHADLKRAAIAVEVRIEQWRAITTRLRVRGDRDAVHDGGRRRRRACVRGRACVGICRVKSVPSFSRAFDAVARGERGETCARGD